MQMLSLGALNYSRAPPYPQGQNSLKCRGRPSQLFSFSLDSGTTPQGFIPRYTTRAAARYPWRVDLRLDPFFSREAASQGGMTVSGVQAQGVVWESMRPAGRVSYTVETTVLPSFAQRCAFAGMMSRCRQPSSCLKIRSNVEGDDISFSHSRWTLEQHHRNSFPGLLVLRKVRGNVA